MESNEALPLVVVWMDRSQKSAGEPPKCCAQCWRHNINLGLAKIAASRPNKPSFLVRSISVRNGLSVALNTFCELTT